MLVGLIPPFSLRKSAKKVKAESEVGTGVEYKESWTVL
jgi:hypothetical protein